MAGCDTGLGESSGGKGSVVMSLVAPGLEKAREVSANILRTVFPTIPSDTFAKYKLSFDPGGDGAVITDEITSGTTGTFTLKVATYTVSVTGYNSSNTPIALGKVEGVSVTEGGTTPVSIELGPITEGSPDPGTFDYNVTINDGLSLDDSSKLYVTTAADTGTHIDINGGDAGTDITVTNTGAAGSVSLAPGYYRVWIELKESGTEAEASLPGEVMHIYSGLTSSFTRAFTAAHFGEPTGEPPLPAVVSAFNLSGLITAPVTGVTPVTEFIGQAQYTGEIEWQTSGGDAVSGSFAASEVYKAVLTLTAKPGYTFIGVAANAFTCAGAASITNAADSGTVTVTFPETEDEGGGDPTDLPGYITGGPDFTTTYSNLGTLLSGNSLTANTETPYVVRLSEFEICSGDAVSGPWDKVKFALTGNSTKNIILDLRYCYTPASASNRIYGYSASATTSCFNRILKDGSSAASGLRGVILPYTITSIDDCSFFSATSLTGFNIIVIPATVTTIGNNAFKMNNNNEFFLYYG